MEKSLALEIREVSRSFRAQEKDYFDRLRMYETGTVNIAIQLKQEDRERMKDEFEDMQINETEMSENMERNKQISDLVKSINQLSTIYKQLNELVIEQGSLIDRIDFNIEETYTHCEKGV
jgi:syntaxin 16